MTTGENTASASGSWSPLTTIVVAIRSAVSAIALIAVFDRQFILSRWLHWALQNWTDFFNFVFAFLPFHIPAQNRPSAAFALIILSTVAFDIFLRWRSTPGSVFPPRVARNAQRLPVQKMAWVMTIILGVTVLLALMGPQLFVPKAVVDAFGPEAIVGLVLAYGLLASPRMFLWLAAFTAAFVGLNEVALLFEQAVPLPPS